MKDLPHFITIAFLTGATIINSLSIRMLAKTIKLMNQTNRRIHQ